MSFRSICSLMLFGLFTLRVPLCWSQAAHEAENVLANGKARVETVLHSFGEDANGAYPVSRVAMARNGRLYGTTNLAGIGGGTVFEMTRSQSGGWAITAEHGFEVNGEG